MNADGTDCCQRIPPLTLIRGTDLSAIANTEYGYGTDYGSTWMSEILTTRLFYGLLGAIWTKIMTAIMLWLSAEQVAIFCPSK